MWALEWAFGTLGKFSFQNNFNKKGKVDPGPLERFKCGYGGMPLEMYI